MSVETTQTQVEYDGDEETLEYAVPFPFLDNSHIKVLWSYQEIVEQVLVEGVDYTLTGAGTGEAGGEVTFLWSPDDGSTILIKRETPVLQPKALRAGGTFGASTHENAWDRLTMIAQEQDARLAAVEAAQEVLAVGDADIAIRTLEFTTEANPEDTFPLTVAVPDGFTAAVVIVGKPANVTDPTDKVQTGPTIGAWEQDGTDINIEHIDGLEGGTSYSIKLFIVAEP